MGQILLVDDEITVRATLSAYLEDEGFEVLQAASAEEALRLVDEGQRPSVCIMDMRLPGMDGQDAILALHARLPELRFLIHTGSLSYGLSRRLRAIGLTDEMVFRKPLADMRVLADAIHTLNSPENSNHA